MSTSNEELLIKVSADTNTAIKEINRLNKEVGTLTKQVDKSKNSTKKQKTEFDNLATSTSKVSGLLGKITLGLGAMGVAFKAVEFAKLAADADQAGDAFERVVTDMGATAEEEFEKIKTAAQGLIPDADIKQSATTALSLGVPLEKLAELMEVARAKSREMGTDAKSAFEDLAKGIGRGSPMILDNLGLTIKLGDANKKMADSLGKTVAQLSKEEKTLALTNAVIESGAESIKRYADASLTSKEETQRFNTALENLKVKIGGALLKPMKALAIETSDFINRLNDEEVDLFSESIRKMGDAFRYAKESGVFGELKDAVTGALGVGTAESAYDIANAIFKMASEASALGGTLTDVVTKISGVTYAMDNMGESKENLLALKSSTYELIQETEKLLKKYEADGSEKARVAAMELGIQLAKLKDIYSALTDKIEDHNQAEKDLVETAKKYTQEQADELSKFYKSRVKEHDSTLKKLTANEKKLASDVIKINDDLTKKLKSIDKERFQSNYDATQKIRELEIGMLPEFQQYSALEKQEAQALADAKVALKQGEYDKYKIYLAEYEKLALASSNRITQGEGSVAATEKQTALAKIKILKDVQNIENKYYSQQEADAKAAHELLVAQKKIEIALVKQRLEGEKAVILAMKQFIEATTGKTVELDMTAIDNAINGIASLEGDLINLGTTITPIQADTISVDQAKQKIEEIKTLTLNGVTLEVDANTTPADFDIKKLIVKEEKNGITMDVNPEYEAAQKDLDAFRGEESSEPVSLGIELTNIQEVQSEIEVIKEPTASEHTVSDNVPKVLSAIDRLKVTTHSEHIIHERIVSSRATGGPLPQKLATGGPFRGSGRVPGYDPTDSDKVNAVLSGGEFVIKRKAVNSIGTKTLHDINNMRLKMPALPRFGEGGLVGGVSSNRSISSELTPINLNIGGQSFGMMGDREVAEALQRFIDSEGGM